ncbi:MAG: deoxyribonuclease IV [Candidatus Izemoplasmatales bacterium]|jgi:deoxyribonuclease-4
MLLIGSHVSLGGKEQMLGSVKEAMAYGANTFMVYTGAPQNTIRLPIEKLLIPEAKVLMNKVGIAFNHVIVHAPYIVNLASQNPDKRQFAVNFITEEVLRTAAIGAKTLVIHPGNHLNAGVDNGISLIIQGINQVIENTKAFNVILALETMAGKGTELGSNFSELRMILDGIHDQNRIGVCFDTCHAHDAGYDVAHDFTGVMAEFNRIIGDDWIKVIHVNDSKNVRGSHKDRHANIGFGHIGFTALHQVVCNPQFQNIPKILETPYVINEANNHNLYPPYKYEIQMLSTGRFNPDMIKLIQSDSICDKGD